jgi:hypothetical protein
MAEAAKAGPLTRRQIEEKIVALAWKDEDFRKAFLADPKKQFEERLGTKLPPGLRISAVAEDENHLHFVIPAKPANLGELSDEDLQKVAGGVDVAISIAVSAAVVAVGGIFATTGAAVGMGAAEAWDKK